MRRRLALAALPALALAACETPQTPPAPTINVFFTAESALLDDNARAVIAQAAARAQQKPSRMIKVRGFAAPDTGTAAYNRALAETRARAVADALVANGIPASRIGIEPRGAVPFTEFPTESRRVEIAWAT
jgi:hypothetical protein